MKKFVILILFCFCVSGAMYAQSGSAGTLKWSIVDNELSVTGNGLLPDYSLSSPAPWYIYKNNITSIRIGEGIITIGAYCFYNLEMAKSLYISSTVRIMNLNAFTATWVLLTEVEIHPNNTAFSSEDEILYDGKKTILYTFAGTREGKYTIPESVITIYDYAFMERKVTSVTIPASVTKINTNAFLNCNVLTEIVNKNPKPQTLGTTPFSGVNLTNCILRVPAGSEGLYAATATWKDFKNIVPIEAEISKLTLTHEMIYLLPGNTATVSAIESGDITWKSSDETVVTVNSTGILTAIKAGTTVITASLGSIEATCTVTVIQPGNSTIEGTIDNSGTGNARVNLYVKPPESGTKKGIVGGYVLLATTIPNENGDYRFENLPEGVYQVEVEIEEYESAATDELPLSESETLTDINFTVDEEEGIIIVAGNPDPDPDPDPETLTGAVETWHAASLQIYPNPFTDAVRINVETGRAPSLQVQIFNTAGATVHTQTIASPDETINLGHLPAGLYIIRLENSGSLQTYKIIKIQ